MIEQELKIVTIATAIIGTISLLSALSIIISISTLRLYKSISHRLILYLAIADIFQCFAVVTNYKWIQENDLNENSAACDFQGFFFTFGDMASSFWSAAICFYVVSFGMSEFIYLCCGRLSCSPQTAVVTIIRETHGRRVFQ